MGRPLNKKYFGNENTGLTGADRTNYNGLGGEGIGGKSIASYTINNVGSYWINANNAAPTIAISAPEEPTGVQATATVTWEVDYVTVTNGLSGHNYTVGLCTFTGLGGGVVGHIGTVGSGQGEVQAIDFTTAGANRGSFTTVPTAAVTYQVAEAGSDNGNQVNVYFRVKSIAVNNSGEGYITPTMTFTDGTHTAVATVTPVLAADSGTPYNGQAYSAIVIYAKTTSGGSVLVGDIIKQEGSRRYKVRTNDGTSVVKLVATTPGYGCATITATDSAGGTYYVTKLTAHKALLTQNTGTQFATGASVKWTLGSATAGYSVTIANA